MQKTDGNEVVIPGAPATQEDLTQELLHDSLQTGSRMRKALLISGVLSILGFVGLIMHFASGSSDHTTWNFYAVVYFYVFSVTMGIPMASIGLRMARAQWRRPTSRSAELFAIAGPINLIFFIPILLVAPPIEGRNSLWMDWALAPWFPDIIMMVLLVVTGLAFLYVSLLPDLASVRDHGIGRAQRIATILSRDWNGTKSQWSIHKSALGILGAFYITAYAMTHLVLATDFAMTLVPGWKDPIFPAFHAVTGIQMGTALLIVTMYLLRRLGGFGRYFELEQFWGYSRLLLALSLFYFYFWWCAFILFWYARLPHEQAVVALFISGDYADPSVFSRPQFLMFLGAIGFSFFLPLLLLMWNVLRRSIVGPTIVGVIILIGGFFDRMRLYANAWSVDQVGGHGLEYIPEINAPTISDLFVMVGMISSILFLYLLVSRVVGFVSLWETRQALLLRFVKPWGVGHVSVVIKPE
jgi:molybdopterin-containing oxidoreductase family membrane subunit